ncbi:MAG: hypothetical protein WCJ55_09975 [Chloroflexales bacterium]
MLYPFRLLRAADTPSSAQSAAVAKRRLHDTLPMDRAQAVARHDDSERLLSYLLQEDLSPKERIPA